MNVDGIDLELFLYFLENGNTTSTVCDVVKGLYDIKDRDDLIKKTTMITYRLNKWLKKKFFHIKTINKVRHYTINMNAIYYGKCNLEIGESTTTMGNAIVFEMADHSYIVHFL